MPHWSRRLARTSSLALAGASGLHAVWGAGSHWPAKDPTTLADAVAGTTTMPPPAACFVVAGALGAASAMAAGVGGDRLAARRGRAAVAGVLLARGVTGLTGRTRVLVPWTPSPRFVHLDRQAYGPLCFGLGAAVALVAGTRTPGRSRQPVTDQG